MPKLVSALTARTQLGQIIRRASTDQDRFVVGKRGEPVVVIMGIKDFLKNIAPEPDVLAAIRSEASDPIATKALSLTQSASAANS